jgi:hypothetical protein
MPKRRPGRPAPGRESRLVRIVSNATIKSTHHHQKVRYRGERIESGFEVEGERIEEVAQGVDYHELYGYT